MKLRVQLIALFLLMCSASMAQHISDFSSLGPATQDDTIHIPQSHSFQVIIQSGDTLSDGSIMPEKIDFTGFMQKDEDQNEAWLAINCELDSGAVIILDLMRNLNSGLWEVEHAEGLENIDLLGGTSKNCSGQVTPWKTFISCEETLKGGDSNGDGYSDFGWCFEIDPVTRKVLDYDNDGTPDKLWELGRMYHENVAIASDLKTVYFGDDREHSGFVYKFVCDSATKLNKGKAYVLQVTQLDSAIWIPLQGKDIASLTNMPGIANLSGATNFRGVEDFEIKSDGRIFFSSKFQGAVFSFIDYGPAGIHNLDTFLGPQNRRYEIVNNGNTDTVLFRQGADNIAIDKQDNLWLLQDELHMTDSNYVWVAGNNHSRLTPDLRIFASVARGAEPSGITFTPDNSHLFMSVMHPDTFNQLTQNDVSGDTILFNRSACISVAISKEFLPEQKIIIAEGSSACLNDSMILTVRERDRFQFQWFRDTVPLPGQTDTFLVVRDTADYWCSIAGFAGTAYTDTFSSLFVTKPHALINLSGSGIICANDTTHLLANKDSNWVYSWRLDSTVFITDSLSTLSVNKAGNYDVIVNDRYCLDTSNVQIVQHLQLPDARIFTAGNLDVCIGDSVQLKVDSFNATNIYKWWQNRDSIVSIGDTILIARASSDYQLIVDAINGCSDTSAISRVTVNSLPNTGLNFIQDSSFCQGSVPMLQANLASLAYQWFRNGDSLNSDTSQALSIATSGSYYVQVSNQYGCTDTSEHIKMTLDSVQTSFLNYQSLTPICTGSSIELQMLAKPWASYQWLDAGMPIVGASSNSYTTGTMGSYQLISYNRLNQTCRDTSNAVSISVHDHPVVSLDTIGNPEFCQGDSVRLRWNTFGTPGIWKWFRNGGLVSQAVSEEIRVQNSGNYQAIFTSFAGCLDTSSITAVTVNPLPNNSLNTSSTDTTLCNGQNLSLSAVQSGLIYQWRRNGSPLPSETSRTLNTVAAGTYTLDLLTSKGCSGTSSAVLFELDSMPNIQLNISGPTTFCDGSSVTLSTPHHPWQSYVWFKNGNGIPGETNSSYIVRNEGFYHLLAFNTQNPSCREVTTPINVTVHTKPQLGLDTIGSPNICSGDSLILRANSNGRMGTWDWRRNGALVQRSSSPQLIITQAGQYTAQFVDSNSCSESLQATSVNILSRPRVSLLPTGTTNLCQGDSLKFQNGMHQNGVSYRWYRNNALIPGEVNKSIQAKQAGSYHFTAKSSNGCEEESGSSQVAILNLPQATLNINSSDTSICDGSSLRLAALNSGLSYQWFLNNSLVTGQTSSSIIATSPGIYQLKVTDANNCSDESQLMELELDSMPDVNVSLSGPLAFCSGKEVILSATNKSWADYQWYDANLTLPGDTNSIYKAKSPGSFKVIMVNSNNSNCNDTSASYQVSLFPNPQIRLDTIGNSVFCIGDSVLLRASSFGVTGNWKWKEDSSTSIPISTDSSLFIKNSLSLYPVFTDANGCQDSMAATNITANSLPDPSLNLSDTSRICLGDSLNITVVNPVLRYRWFRDGSLLAFNGQRYNATSSGSYRVELEDVNGCKSMSDDLFVITDSLPDASLTQSGSLSFCENDSVTLKGEQYPWARYQWLKAGVPVVGNSTPELISKTSSNYQLIVWNDTNSSCRDSSNIQNTTRWNNPVVEIDTIGSYLFCLGDSVILKSNVTGSGLLRWRLNSQPVGSINDTIITAYQSGIYTSHIIDTNFCTATDTVEVFSKTLPQVSLLSASTEFCFGDSLLIRKTTSHVSSIKWFENGQAISPIDSFWKNYSGTVVLQVADSNACQNSDSITVLERSKLMPLVRFSKPIVCLGDSVELSADRSNYLTYKWLLNGSPVSLDSSLTVSSIGTYSYVVSDDLGCQGTSIGYNLVLEPLPPVLIKAQGSTEFCFGDSVQLNSDSVRSDFSYQWFSNGIPILGATQSSLIVKNSANFSLSITDSNSCYNRFDSLPIRALAPPKKPIIVKITDTLRVDTADKYQWYLNDTAILNSNSPWIIGFVDGNYHVIVTDTITGCSLASSIFSYSRTQVVTVSNEDIKIYPNPSSGLFTLEFLSNDQMDIDIEVYNALGEKIAFVGSQGTRPAIYYVDLSRKESGLYFFRIKVGSKFFMRPIIVQD